MKMLSYTLMILVAAAAVMTSPSDAVSDVISVSRSHRARRQSATRLKPEQQKVVVDRHNTLRALEGASNMELMSWNDSLAELVATWSEGCLYKHPTKKHSEYTGIGQNLYAATTPGPVNLTFAIQLWYDEKPDYTYETTKCVDEKKCGHYTAIVWASTTHVGCAHHVCNPLKESRFAKGSKPTKFVVCNYSPMGNVKDQKPYLKGAACSKCPNGAGWCSKKLCNNKCSTRGDDCPWSSCAAVCHNCATLDQQTCRCSCAAGWRGVDCSVPCEDTSTHCGDNHGYPAKWCDMKDKYFVRRDCPAMCGDCTPDPDAKPGKCPPVYGPAALAATSFIGVHQVSLVFAMVVVSLTGSTAL